MGVTADVPAGVGVGIVLLPVRACLEQPLLGEEAEGVAVAEVVDPVDGVRVTGGQHQPPDGHVARRLDVCTKDNITTSMPHAFLYVLQVVKMSSSIIGSRIHRRAGSKEGDFKII